MRVLMVGPYHGKELKYIPSEIELINVNGPCAVKALPDEEFDAVLVTCFNSHSYRIVELGITKYKCPVGIWFLDSHVQFHVEIKVAQLLPFVFVAHGEYINDFKKEMPGKEIYHLPCCVSPPMSIDDWGPLAESREYDLYQACRAYPSLFGGSRIKVLSEIPKILPQYKIKLDEDIKQVQMAEELRKTYVGLNVSLGGDFNCRNMEIIASGLPVLADRTSDHSSPMLEGINDFTAYFDRNNISTIKEAIHEAMSKREYASKFGNKWALNHSYAARTLFMLNIVMKTNYRMVK